MSIGAVLYTDAPSIADDTPIYFSSETLLGFFGREEISRGASGLDVDTYRVIPVYEYLTLGYVDEERPYALHVHGWARTDLGDGDYYENETDCELLYGYLSYRTHMDRFQFRLGRRHIFSGVTNDSVDGIEVSAALGPYLNVMAYGGYPAAYEAESGRSGDSILGGKATVHTFMAGEMGVSFKRLVDDGQLQEETGGLDLTVQPAANAVFSAYLTYNLDTEEWQALMVDVKLDLKPVYLKPFFQRFNYDDFFSDAESQPQPFRYLQDSGEELTIYGSDIVWQQNSRFDAGIRVKQYDYDLRQEASRYTAVLLNFYGNGGTRYGLEGGLMDGESEENQYSLGRAYWFWDTPFNIMKSWFMSLDAIYIRYQEEIYQTDRSVFVSLGGGKELMADRLQLKISGDYSSDPYFDADLRLMVALTYVY